MGSGKSADVRTLDRAVTIAVRVIRGGVETGFEVTKLIIIRLEKVGRWRRVLVEPLFINRGVKAAGIPLKWGGCNDVG